MKLLAGLEQGFPCRFEVLCAHMRRRPIAFYKLLKRGETLGTRLGLSAPFGSHDATDAILPERRTHYFSVWFFRAARLFARLASVRAREVARSGDSDADHELQELNAARRCVTLMHTPVELTQFQNCHDSR